MCHHRSHVRIGPSVTRMSSAAQKVAILLIPASLSLCRSECEGFGSPELACTSDLNFQSLGTMVFITELAGIFVDNCCVATYDNDMTHFQRLSTTFGRHKYTTMLSLYTGRGRLRILVISVAFQKSAAVDLHCHINHRDRHLLCSLNTSSLL